MVTRIIIARHGNTFTKDQTPLRVGAETDLPLVETERGTNVGKYLKMRTLIPVAVFAAPLKRTTETARLAIAALDKDIPLIADNRFTEIDYGPDEAKTEEEVVTNLNDVLISEEVFSGDGLYKVDDVYYFRGSDVDNYLLYSGRLFRIVGIDQDGGIKLISDEVNTVIYDGRDESVDSYVDDWLNNVYLDTLNQDYLTDTSVCSDYIDTNITCNDVLKENISSLSLYDYMQANDTESYLNNGSYFWLKSKKSDNTTWYVDPEGISSTTTNKVSLGVRPVITLKKD